MQRRRFLFWVGLGLFNLGEKLRADGFDQLAAATMKAAGSGGAAGGTNAASSEKATHWRAESNSNWQWYERETLVGGRWKVTGITTPIHRETGEPYTERTGYLDPSLVPADLRVWDAPDPEEAKADGENVVHRPDPARRARHGRPPSRWLRSLNADELRIWLKTIDVPEAGVEGMTYWTHLTRDHYFLPAKIEGLSIAEQAKLHAAAHEGY